MNKCLLVLTVIILAALIVSCTTKQGDTIVNNSSSNNTYIIAEDSLWEPTNGPYGCYVSDIRINNKDEIFINGNDFLDGSYWIKITSDYGKTWKNIITNFKDTVSYVFINDRLELILSSKNRYYVSKDYGNSWTKIFDSIPGKPGSQFLDLDSKGNIYANGITAPNTYTYSLYKSTDMGKSWKAIYDSKNFTVYIFIDLNDNIFAKIYNNTPIYLSKDYGSTWNEIVLNNNKNGNLSQDNKGNLYLKYSNLISYRSMDHGATWTKFNYEGLNNEGIYDIYVSNKGNYYLATYYGIKMSADNGNSWHQLIKTDKQIQKVVIDSKGYLYALMSNGVINRTKKPVE